MTVTLLFQVLFLDHPKKKIRDTQKYKPFKSQVKVLTGSGVACVTGVLPFALWLVLAPHSLSVKAVWFMVWGRLLTFETKRKLKRERRVLLSATLRSA